MSKFVNSKFMQKGNLFVVCICRHTLLNPIPILDKRASKYTSVGMINNDMLCWP
jgi:hypothetical protein